MTGTFDVVCRFRKADASLLRADDWLHERTSRVFTLGEILHLEAFYTGPDPGERRVFLDNCVATLTPDPGSVPRYYFIEKHG